MWTSGKRTFSLGSSLLPLTAVAPGVGAASCGVSLPCAAWGLPARQIS